MARLDKLTGALLIGVILSTILCGILTVQTFLYLARFPGDRKSMRRMVVVLWVIDLVHQACACCSVYHYVINFRDHGILARNTWSISAFHSLEPILALVVQMFFVQRFQLLNPRWWPFTFVMAALALVSFGFGFTASIRTYSMEYFEEFIRDTWIVIIWLVLCAVCDILIACGIASTLHFSRSGVKATDRLIAKLIVWTINTGAFPAFFAILELMFFLTMNHSFTFIGTDIVLAKLYSNSLLAFLNRRKSPLDRTQPETKREVRCLITLDVELSDISEGSQSRQPISDLPQASSFDLRGPKSTQGNIHPLKPSPLI